MIEADFTFALFILNFELIQSAQRESNPRFRHGKAAGYRYITGAYHRTPSTEKLGTLELLELGTPKYSGSGGNRTHVHLLKRQAPSQRRTHFRKAVPRGIEPPLFSLTGRRPLHWPAGPCCRAPTSRWRRNRTPQARAVGFGDRVRSQTRSPPVANRSSTPCGSRTRPKRLERPPTSPEVERGVAPRTKKGAGRGSLLPPAGADAITWRAGGYPLVSGSRCAPRPKPASLASVAARYAPFATLTAAAVRRSSVIACQGVMVVSGVRCVPCSVQFAASTFGHGGVYADIDAAHTLWFARNHIFFRPGYGVVP